MYFMRRTRTIILRQHIENKGNNQFNGVHQYPLIAGVPPAQKEFLRRKYACKFPICAGETPAFPCQASRLNHAGF